MEFKKNIDYYLKNGPDKVTPKTREETFNTIINSNGGGLDSLLKSPFSLSDAQLKVHIESMSKNLIKYYPWKLYIDIAKKRNLNIEYLLSTLPDVDLFRIVDENEHIPEY